MRGKLRYKNPPAKVLRKYDTARATPPTAMPVIKLLLVPLKVTLHQGLLVEDDGSDEILQAQRVLLAQLSQLKIMGLEK